MKKSYWLVKSEPEAFSWKDMVQEHQTDWTGVRNYTARLNLAAMETGDLVLFYESVSTKAVVGLVSVVKTAFPDSTTSDPRWIAVRLECVRPLQHLVPLSVIKADDTLSTIPLIRQSRLSVMQLKADEFERIIYLSERSVN